MTLKTTPRLFLLSTCLLLIRLATAAVPNPKDASTAVGAFTCAGKVIGGYYADVYENCQMFHVCTIGVNEETRDIVFRCLNGTVFDQETRVCERQEEVDCSQSESFFHLNNVLYGPGIIPDTAMDTVEGRTPTQQQVLDPSDALMGVAAIPSPDDAPHQLTSLSNPPTTHGSAASEDTPALQTTTLTPSQSFEQQLLLLLSHEPDILKANPFPSSSPHSVPKSPTRDHPPALPFTVTRTASSSSVSASARIHIETPFSRFTLRQGADDAQAPALPAPHLRPSLLKLAAQAMTERARRQSRRTRSVANLDDTILIRQHLPSLSILPVSLLTKTPQIERPSTGYAHFRSRFLLPRFRGTLKQDWRQTQTQKFRDNETPPTRTTSTTTIDSESACRGKRHALLIADPQTDCEQFRTCIPQLPHSELTRSFVCADEGFAFDQQTAKCARREEIECSPQMSPFPLSIADAEVFAVYTLGLCSFMGKGAFVVDTFSGCEQYFQCPFAHQSAVAVKRCPDGFLFSQTHQKCLITDKVHCYKEVFSLSKLVQLKISGILQDNVQWDAKHSKEVPSLARINTISEIPLLSLRRRRALTLGDENPRQSPSGALNDPAGIVNDHVSVIEAQSPGNIVETKESFPRITLQPDARSTQGSGKHPVNQIDIILKKNRANPPSVRPETSLGINKTTLNGTTIEVSEIAAPDHKGIVTITSVVPKTVRQNGNGGSKTTRAPINDFPFHSPTVITNGKTKITLLGSEPSSPSDETRLEEESRTTLGDGKSNLDAGDSTITAASSTDKETVIKETQAASDEPSTGARETTTLKVEETTEAALETDDVTLQETPVTEESMAELTTDMPTSTTKEAQMTSTVSATPIPTSTTTSTTTTTTTTTTTNATTTTTQSTTSIEPRTEPSTETNFTCKDKVLDKFYPDIEKNCKLFHYCSPGFTKDEVLDLTFVCSGDTRFDIHTKKCQDMTTVACGGPEAASTTATTSSTSALSSSTTTTTPTTTTPTTTTTTTTSTTTAAETATTAAPSIVPETTYSPTLEENEDGTTHSISTSAGPDTDITTLKPAGGSTETEIWDTKQESTTTNVVIEVEDKVSNQHHSLKMESEVEGDKRETTKILESPDFNREQTVFSTSEVTFDTSNQPSSSDVSTVESTNNEITASVTSEKPSLSDRRVTVLSETEASTEDPRTSDFNTNLGYNVEKESFSTVSPTDITTDAVIPDNNLNLITGGGSESLSTSFPSETSTFIEAHRSATETPPESEVVNH